MPFIYDSVEFFRAIIYYKYKNKERWNDMLLSKYKIKLRKNPGRINEGLPRYSLTYKSDPVTAARTSHEILSAFIGGNDVVIEINTDMSGPLHDQDDPVEAFLVRTGAFGLACRKRKVLSEKDKTVLGFAVRSKRQACEALIYIPNSVWNHPDMMDCLPLYGARYYITEETGEFSSKLDEIAMMSEEDKAQAFRMIVFDLAICGQMGVTSSSLSLEEIKGMLGF